jgi:electron transfer flavoprotein alpha subunit
VFVVLLGPLSPPDAAQRLLGVARRILEDEDAVWAFAPEVTRDLAIGGADRVVAHSAFGTRDLDMAVVLDVLRSHYDSTKPVAVLFPDTLLGREAAARFAVEAGLEVARDLTRVESRKFVSYGVGYEWDSSDARVLVIEPEHFTAPVGVELGEARSVEAIRKHPVALDVRAGLIEREAAAHMPLEEAPLVFAVGMGVGDIDAARHVALRLGAAFGATRPVCDAGRVERSRQIGASGRRTSPDVYVALGISGAQQHMDGIAGARFVAAANVNPAAPIMSRADLALQVDADALIEELERRLGGG